MSWWLADKEFVREFANPVPSLEDGPVSELGNLGPCCKSKHPLTQ